MARNGAGTYVLPAGQPVVSGSTISSSTFNTLTTDLANALTSSLAVDGQTPPTANLPMAGFKHTNVALAVANTDYARFDQAKAVTGFINVKLPPYNAAGDGVTDDTVAINAAIAAVNASSGPATLFFPPGNYLVSAALTTITRNYVSVLGAGHWASVIKQSSTSANTLSFQSTDLVNAMQFGVTISGLALQYTGAGNPSAGTMLALQRVQEFMLDGVRIVSGFLGLTFTGCVTGNCSNLMLSNSTTWTSLVTGSRLLAFYKYTGSVGTGTPAGNNSEIRFVNLEAKGNGTTSATLYLDVAIESQSVDGLWINNAQMGFAATAVMKLGYSVADRVTTNLECTSCYFDGGIYPAGGSCKGVWLTGYGAGATPTVIDSKFLSCVFANLGSYGVHFDNLTCSRVRFTDGSFQSNNASDIRVDGVTGNNTSNLTINGCVFWHQSTTQAAPVDGIYIASLNTGEILNCRFYGVTQPFNYGINIDANSNSVLIADNSFNYGTSGFSQAPILCSTNKATFSGNHWNGGPLEVPTIASAATLPVYIGFEKQSVSGTTNITGGLSWAGTNVPNGTKIELQFQSALTISTGGTLKLSTGGGSMTTTTGSTLNLRYHSGTWYETGRVVI